MLLSETFSGSYLFFSVETGRPKSDKATLTNAARKRKWGEKNRDKEREKDRARKSGARNKLSQEGKKQL